MDGSLAEQVYLQFMHHIKDKIEGIFVVQGIYPWVREYEFCGSKYAVAMVNEHYYTVVPLPFEGHKEEWDVMPPINSISDLSEILKHPDMIALEDALDNAPVVFGLIAQGHIPTIEKMLTQSKTWKEIGDAIGWDGGTAEQHYQWYAESRLKAWPSPQTVSLICARVGDPYWNGAEGSVEMNCWNCNHPVMCSPQTIETSKARESRIICIPCAVVYSRNLVRKFALRAELETDLSPL
jgi:hypothetical protein